MNASAICLALAIYFEARGEPITGQIAVGQVVLNRVESKRWPNTICEVVKQHKQFSFYSDGKSDTPRNLKAWQVAKAVANRLLIKSKVHKPLPDLSNGSNHYHANTVSPYWKDKFFRVVVIGNHIFYKQEKGKKNG